MNVSSSPNKLRVWLIHGTFGSRASFLQPGSTLRQLLQDRLAPATVEFETPTWGWFNNSFLARRAAATLIADSVKASAAEHPAERRILIAHSHGGNVAVEVASSLAPSGMDVEIVTFATPFISSKPRDLSIFLVLLLMVVGGGAQVFWSIAFYDWIVDRAVSAVWAPRSVAVLLGASVAWLSVAGVVAFYQKELLDKFGREYKHWLPRGRHSPKCPAPILVLTIDEDEAGRWLGFLVGAGRAFGVIAAAVSAFVVYYYMFPYFESMSSDVRGGFWLARDLGTSPWTVWFPFAWGTGLAGFAYTFVTGVYVAVSDGVTRIVSATLIGSPAGFGGFLRHLVSHVWTSRLPSGTQVKWLLIVPEEGASVRGLKHTLYENPEAVKAAVEWIATEDRTVGGPPLRRRPMRTTVEASVPEVSSAADLRPAPLAHLREDDLMIWLGLGLVALGLLPVILARTC